jgi:hypothetical protein
MILKTFFLTKEIRAIRTKKLRGKKSLRDHRAMTPSARRARPRTPAPGCGGGLVTVRGSSL